jgi:hypothetical protein
LKDLFELGGRGLLHKYNNSVALLISTIYTEHEWLPWKFEHSPRNFWNDPKNVRKFLDWAGKQLGVTEYNDWHRITIKEIVEIGGKSLLRSTNFSLSQILNIAYPEHSFHNSSKSAYYKKTQAILRTMLHTMLQHEGFLFFPHCVYF